VPERSDRLQQSGALDGKRTLPAQSGKGKGPASSICRRRWVQRLSHVEAAKDAETPARPSMAPVLTAGVKPWVRLKNAGEAEFGAEISYWSKQTGGRQKFGHSYSWTFIIREIKSYIPPAAETAGGIEDGGKIPITLAIYEIGFLAVRQRKRTGEALPDGTEFSFKWKQNEAVVLSFGP